MSSTENGWGRKGPDPIQSGMVAIMFLQVIGDKGRLPVIAVHHIPFRD